MSIYTELHTTHAALRQESLTIPNTMTPQDRRHKKLWRQAVIPRQDFHQKSFKVYFVRLRDQKPSNAKCAHLESTAFQKVS